MCVGVCGRTQTLLECVIFCYSVCMGTTVWDISVTSCSCPLEKNVCYAGTDVIYGHDQDHFNMAREGFHITVIRFIAANFPPGN